LLIKFLVRETERAEVPVLMVRMVGDSRRKVGLVWFGGVAGTAKGTSTSTRYSDLLESERKERREKGARKVCSSGRRFWVTEVTSRKSATFLEGRVGLVEIKFGRIAALRQWPSRICPPVLSDGAQTI